MIDGGGGISRRKYGWHLSWGRALKGQGCAS